MFKKSLTKLSSSYKLIKRRNNFKAHDFNQQSRKEEESQQRGPQIWKVKLKQNCNTIIEPQTVK